MKLLITGATGFIGQHLQQALGDEHELFLLGRKDIRQDNYFSCDLLEPLQLERLPSKIDGIIHAASILATPDNHQSLSLFQDNVRLTERVLELTRHYQPQLLIHLSSIGVYPNQDGTYTEESVVRPSDNFEGLYGLAKFCSEELLTQQLKQTSTRVLNLRLAQTLGEGMRADRIYSIMRQELEESNVISVWGKGERVSAFLTIPYLMQVIKDLLQHPTVAGVFNVAEFNWSYQHLAEQVLKQYGKIASRIQLVDKGVRSQVYIDKQKLQEALYKNNCSNTKKEN